MGKIHYLCKYNRKNHEIIKEHFFPLSGIKVQNDILMVIIRIFFNSIIWNFIKIPLEFWIMELKKIHIIIISIKMSFSAFNSKKKISLIPLFFI